MRILLTISCLLTSLLLCAQEPQSLFQEANQKYNEKQFHEAIELYETIADQNYQSPELFYNLGNAYFKLEKLAPAILNYERAKRLDPNNEDILFNIKLANLRVADRLESSPDLFFINWVNKMVHGRSPNGWTRIAVILLWVAFAMGIVYLSVNIPAVRKIAFVAAFFFMFLSFLSIYLTYNQIDYEENNRFAIVFSTNSYVKSAPDEESVDIFILREGVKVELLGEENGWGKIKLQDGKIGWIKQEDVEVI